jgi:hypothetical protein
MLLRESSEPTEGIDVAAVMDRGRDSGLPNSVALTALTDACIARRWEELAAACAKAEAVMGADAVRDVLIVAAGFNGITRVADATGIPLDNSTAAATETLRRDFAIDRFDYAAKSARFDVI